MKPANSNTDSQVLCWPKRLLSAEDLRRHLTSQRELEVLPKTIITPLAMDELKAKGIRLTWQIIRRTDDRATVVGSPTPTSTAWAVAAEKLEPALEAAIRSLTHDGVRLTQLSTKAVSPWQWAVEIATEVETGRHSGVVVFTGDPGLICCVANKVSGLRAVSVMTVSQATRARQNLAANFLAVEWPGRTLFEIRQILKTAASTNVPCSESLANQLKELDGHAHR